MSRSKWKGFFLDKQFLKIAYTQQISNVWTRRSIIPGSLLNKKVEIYTGRTFKRIMVTRGKIGYKFGEFAPSRQQYGRTLKTKNKR